MKRNSELAIFILSHGRADNVHTYKALKKSGYEGEVYIIVDNEDSQIEKYRENFDNVIVFDKAEIAKTFDKACNFGKNRTIVYARNACFDIAEKLGYTYFMQLDDDYTAFDFRIDSDMRYKVTPIKDVNKTLDLLLDYYKSIPALSLAIAQGGDFIGGVENGFEVSMTQRRKAMNTFICSTKRRFQFLGNVNEDVNTYARLGEMGNLFITFALVSITQKPTQSNDGGMTGVYLDSGTYIKSFYTVIYNPSSVKVEAINGNSQKRLHHKINWKHAVPKIVRENLRRSN